MTSHKELAQEFLQMAGSGKVKEAYEKCIAPNLIHHNQYFKGDRHSLLEAMEAASKNSPNKSINVKYIYEDGATVITHSEVVRMNADDPRIAVVHIFRFENNKVVELWDLGQLIDKNSPNENGCF